MSTSNWLNQLKQHSTIDSAIEFFIQTSPAPALYFRYLQTDSWLVLDYIKKNLVKEIAPKKPICLRLYESYPSFHPSELHHPQKIPIVHQTITKELSQNYLCYPLVFNKSIIGILAYTAHDSLSNRLLMLDYYIKNLLWIQKWEQSSQIDEVTGCFNQKFLLQILFKEISRSRRLLLPVSLIVLSIDQLPTLESTYGTDMVHFLLKALSKIIFKDARSYDTLGILPNQKLVIILPHTSERGASMKAEKIRWMIQSADFSKVFPAHNRLSLSLGVVEYPKASRSADALLRYANKALDFAAKDCEGNITAVASPAAGFKPDFIVPESRHHLLRDLT